ncbi:MAG: Uma2 family endonuclease [Bacteroidota bacterium]
MLVKTQIPKTLKERMELEEELRVPASFEDFLDLLEKCEYRIEYDEGQIISFMGYATRNHEIIVAHLIRLIGNLIDLELYSVFGSNLALHVPGFGKRYYNADCVVVKGEDEEVTLRGTMKAIANPVLIIEVLSASSYDFDLGGKFRNYKKIPSLQQVIYIDSTEMSVLTYTRYNGQDEWLLREFTDPAQEVPILSDGILNMADIYNKIKFNK